MNAFTTNTNNIPKRYRNAFISSKNIIAKQKPLARSASTTSLFTSFHQNQLEKLTVVKLRSIVKELYPDISPSKFRLKQDLISFLIENHLNERNKRDDTNGKAFTPIKTKSSATSTKVRNGATTTVTATKTRKYSTTNKKRNIKKRIEMPTAPPAKKDYFENQILYPGMERSNVPSDNDDDETSTKDDLRCTYHPIFTSLPSKTSDLDISFIGTASCVPSITRGSSCTALRLNWRRGNDGRNNNDNNNQFQSGTWLFDCGECTQLQIQRSKDIKPSKVSKIFVTHSHGDHTFGLPGLLCLMGQDRDRSSPPIEIYGPEGLRQWLRVAIRYSVSRIVPNYIVHELKNVPMAPEWKEVWNNRNGRRLFYYDDRRGRMEKVRWGDSSNSNPNADRTSWISRCNNNNAAVILPPDQQFGEIGDGRDIYPIYNHPLSSNDNAPVYEVLDEGDVTVYAAPMSHSIPCVGYVVEECSKPGRLKPELIKPIVEKNFNGLKEMGYRLPMKVLATIKSLPKGDSFTFPDGTIVKQEDVVEEERIGRKIVICGDTSNSRSLENVGKNADILVHEATNTYLPQFDKDTSLLETTQDAKSHGHSTPYMAGAFARRIQAKKLILNHFSSRYKGDATWESMCVMRNFEKQAIDGSRNWLNDETVVSSWDFMTLPIPTN